MPGVSRIVVVAVVLFLATATACRDAITGSGAARIRGSVDLQDAWGNELADRSGVEVAVDGNATHAMTDASGTWYLDGVSPGHHDVIFTKLGFGQFRLRDQAVSQDESLLPTITMATTPTVQAIVDSVYLGTLGGQSFFFADGHLSGALFGFFKGVVVAWVGLVLGTSGAYWIARLIGGASVKRLVAGHEDIVAKLHGRRGFLTLLRLRAIPLIPSLLLDYAAGTARMDYLAYVGATMLGSFMSTAIFVFLASHVATGLTTGAAHQALLWSVGAGAVLVAMSFAPALVRRMRRT